MPKTKRLEAGFYGTDSDVYYVTPSGRAFLVATNDTIDLSNGPREVSVAGVAKSAEPISPRLMEPEEVARWLKDVEDETGETLVEHGG